MNKHYLFYLLLPLIILSSVWGANVTLAQVNPTEPACVSLVQLIANPSEFHGKVVRVIGYCRLRFEGNAIYLHREDFDHGITKNAVWIDVGNIISTNNRELSDRYVLVEGVFNAKDNGHLDLFSGSLRIRKIGPWRSPNELKQKQGVF